MQFQQALDDNGIPVADFLLKYDYCNKDKYTVEVFVVISCYDKATLDKVRGINLKDYIDTFRIQLMCPWTSAKDLYVYAMPEDLIAPVFDHDRNLLVNKDGVPIDGWTCKIFAVAKDIKVLGEEDFELGLRFKFDLTLVSEEVTDGITKNLVLTL